MAMFVYDALTEPDSIRLLALEPSTEHTAPIRCSLIHTTLASCKHDIIDHYTALSYVWGDPDASQSISINGKKHSVTRNLFHALQDIRDDHRLQRLWIDAICIDQSNVEERNCQVNMMGPIYTVARHTIIYLGRAFLDSTPAFETISLKNGYRDFVANSNLLQLVTNGILARPWFPRVWIFQELVLSRDPRI